MEMVNANFNVQNLSNVAVNGVALVTGGAAGISEETGFAFAEADASGVIFATSTLRGPKRAQKRVNTIESESVQAMVDLTIEEFGRIDYFVNSAGVKGRHGDERSLGLGCIVNLGSGLSYGAGPGMMAYVASKHAVMGITKVAALDNAKHEIRVNALCPSWVKTPMLERSLARWAGLEKVIQAVSPARRAATPEEVANVAVFLCSPSATYVNGTGLLIDAGMMVTAHAS
ncbi:uncharacterized protein EAE98_001853 [Botrytis deweyae]|uniref:Uncharacterized protein n=1 Tax=Botrytis deweyae TaxID=2478750 RepID=A0ABQ7IZ17_9HELO|nr:uncharacterized protein EAE98_001853 [Botrytis deweyae]KAF7937539.1 hypothetical protein EAE98_001853 [Botrytis deweyae]